MYRCRKEDNCINLSQLCDGIKQCKDGDDELMCNTTCPIGCRCVGLTALCHHAGLTAILNLHSLTRKLDASNNNLNQSTLSTSGLSVLGELIIHHNNFTQLTKAMFQNLANLYRLDASHNQIRVLQDGVFDTLLRLKYLDLSHNAIVTIEYNVFYPLDSLITLNISGNDIRDYKMTMFSKLNRESFYYLTTDNYKFCCLAQWLGDNCYPPKDEFSSCEDLMEQDVLRVCLWAIGLLSFLGNGAVLVTRVISSEPVTVNNTFVVSLAFADFFMGVYMLMIAIADVYFRGTYIKYADEWRQGIACTVAGFLSQLSSEVSVFMLLCITFDRFLHIVFPFNGIQINMKRANIICVIFWIIGIAIAGIPLLPIEYFDYGTKFYSRSGVCLSLHLTDEPLAGWEYSVFVLLGLNLSSFVLIMVCYVWMYIVIKKSAKASGSKNNNEMAVARKMALIILSDFCCWMPICILGKIIYIFNSVILAMAKTSRLFWLNLLVKIFFGRNL